MITHVAPIVEGHGDVQALPLLLRRVRADLNVARPVRFPKSKLIADGLVRAARIARANVREPEKSLVLLVVDADKDCAANLGPRLLASMKAAIPDVSCFVAVAVREFECWLVGGLPSSEFTDADVVGKPKAKLADLNGGVYSETADQPRFVEQVDVDKLRRCSSSFLRLHSLLIDP